MARLALLGLAVCASVPLSSVAISSAEVTASGDSAAPDDVSQAGVLRRRRLPLTSLVLTEVPLEAAGVVRQSPGSFSFIDRQSNGNQVPADPDAVQKTHEKKTTDSATRSISTLCIVMFGSLGLCWALVLLLMKEGYMKRMAILALLCTSWASTSIGMHVLNKALAAALASPALVSLMQMGIAVGAMLTVACGQLWNAPRAALRKWLIVPTFFAAMLVTSNYAYEFISLSLLTVVRNLTPLVVLPIEIVLMPADKRPHVSVAAVGAILVMLFGALIYGKGVEGISIVGVCFALLNMLLAISDRLIQRRLLTNECKALPSSVCTLMNNGLGMLPTAVLAFTSHETVRFSSSEGQEAWHDGNTMILLVLSGAIGIGIGYLGFECQRAISATSFFVMQNVSKVGVICAGVLFFSDPITPMTFTGLFLSLIGSFMYGSTQLQQLVPPPRASSLGVNTKKMDRDADEVSNKP